MTKATHSKPSEIAALIEREVASLSDARVIDHIRSLLVLPNVVMREWNYGKEPISYPCWSVLELPIWRVYKQENDLHPGVPVTPEGDWDSTWKELYRLREADKAGRYNCWHGIVHEKE